MSIAVAALIVVTTVWLSFVLARADPFFGCGPHREHHAALRMRGFGGASVRAIARSHRSDRASARR